MEVVQFFSDFFKENPNLVWFIMLGIWAMVQSVVQQWIPGSVPFFGKLRKAVDEFSKLTHYHIPQNSTEIKRKALSEGYQLAAKYLEKEMERDNKRKHPDQKQF